MYILLKMSNSIKLVSNVGEVFEVNQEFAKLSHYVNSAMKRAGHGAPVFLNNISSITIRKIIEWASHYNFDPPKFDEDEEKPVVLTQWDIEFLRAVSHYLFHINVCTILLDFVWTDKKKIQITFSKLRIYESYELKKVYFETQ